MDEKLDEKLKPIDGRLNSIEGRLDIIEERLDTIEENTEITRDVLNSVVEWIDIYFRKDYPFPADKKSIV